MPPLETSPYRLLVEGNDDFHSVIHLTALHGYNWDDESTTRPFVVNAGNIEKLLEALPVTLKGPYERVGVLVDADLRLADRWAQLKTQASKAGVALPRSPAADGTILEGPRPGSRVGFWLMPDNSSPGTLEGFLGKLVSREDAVWAYADEVTLEARRRGAPCQEKDHLKSRLHTWLAWQADPGLPFGTALRARIFRRDTADALSFVGWFQRLFGV